jgi:DNA end-binding protein Ku
MPRSLWNGTIVFGGVAVPIKLYSAVESKTVHFHEVHLNDGARIQHRTFCSKENEEVPREEIVKGFEVRPGRYVVIDKADLHAAGGSHSRIIDVDRFVPLSEIDPVFYERSYFVGSQDEGADAYRVLHDALERTGRAAIGRFTFHNREYLAAIRSYDGVLALHTMRFADELVAPGELPVPTVSRGPERREVEMARQLIDSLHEPFRPDKLHDEYREAVLAAIRQKAKGEEVEAPQEPPAEPPDDLMTALQASLRMSRSSGKAAARNKAGRKKARA